MNLSRELAALAFELRNPRPVHPWMKRLRENCTPVESKVINGTIHVTLPIRSEQKNERKEE